MTRKLTLLLIVGLFLTLTITACGESNSSNPPSSQPEPSETNNQAEDNSPLNITMAGASAGGLTQIIGEGFAKTVRTEYPGSTISYEPGGVTDSVLRVASGEAEMAVAPSIVDVQLALKGIAPYEKAYNNNEFYVLAKGDVGSAAHIIMRKEFAEKHGITSVADIAKKKVPLRISINKPGNFGVQKPAREFLKQSGVSIEDIESFGGEVINGGSSTIVKLMKDKKLDMFITHGFPPHGKFLDLASTTDLIMLKTDEEAVQKTIEAWNLSPYTFEAGVYDFVTEQIEGYAKDDYLLISSQVSDEVAYKLAKAYVKNFDQFRQADPDFNDLKLEEMLNIDSSLTFHPGAKKYYEEQGLIK